MCLRTLHDRVRGLGLGLMYERHWSSDFRDLFDESSDAWSATSLPEKVIDLRAFEAAGVPVDELIENYRETIAGQPGGDRVLERLPVAMRAYADAGFRPRLPAN